MNKITFKQFDQKHSKKPETKKNKDPTPWDIVFKHMTHMQEEATVGSREPRLRFNMNWTRFDNIYSDGDNITLRELEQQYQQQISRRQNEHSSF